ncbi:transcriptional regulator family: Fungal Specific TF [Paecilomyces variotii]|nr:transcriptional regulator family: Fungal Specific TF [Paecilomyces variotii]
MSAPRRHIAADDAAEGPPLKRARKKPVACQRCHTHKVKCSGEQPCSRCRLAGHADTCEYVSRDRKLRVDESYIDRLLSENRHLKRELEHSRETSPESRAGASRPAISSQDDVDPSIQNPLLSERAWFQQYDPSAPPIYIAEAACTAFATRLRQFLTKQPTTAHLARTQYVKESTMLNLQDTGVQWPSLTQARLLVKIAFNQSDELYHLMLRKSTLEKLEEIYQTGHFNDAALTCKYFALFAFGQVYSSRLEASADCRVPGTAYYARAMSLIPILPERPSITHLECLVLLSLFSYFLNRRHSGYILIGNAMRFALIIGLTHNIPERQCMGPVEREHRVRIWWVIYMYDRILGSKTGFPLQIQDADIHVDMPSDVAGGVESGQFSDIEDLTASIHLARVTGQIIEKVYTRKKHTETFLQREQRLLLSLKQWMQALPKHLRLRPDGVTPKHIISLHLQFNQCVMLATRPVLLHALIELQDIRDPAAGWKNRDNVPQAVVTLSEACIQAGRHSHSLIVKEWIDGSLPMFGYFHSQYLFSSALVLIISSLLPFGNLSDLGLFETAVEILRSMSAHGNLAAAEFYANLERIKQCLGEKPNRSTTSDVHNSTEQLIPRNTVSAVGAAPFGPDIPGGSAYSSIADYPFPSTAMASGFTTEMAFQNPTMQEFLALSDIDLGPLDPTGIAVGDADAINAYSLWTE